MSLLERTATMQDLINDVDALFAPSSTTPSEKSTPSSCTTSTTTMKTGSTTPSLFTMIYDFFASTATASVNESATNTVTATTTTVPILTAIPTRTGFLPHSPVAKPDVSTSPIAIISTTSKDDECPSLSSSLSSSYSSSSASSSSNNNGFGLSSDESLAALSDMLFSSFDNSNAAATAAAASTVNSDPNASSDNNNNTDSSPSPPKNSLCTTMVLSNSVYCEEHNWDEMQREWERAEEKQVPTPETVPRPGRELRANAAHLRMIAAELNMMRANKIVCPLRPRFHLPPRSDPFIAARSSPLRRRVVALAA